MDGALSFGASVLVFGFAAVDALVGHGRVFDGESASAVLQLLDGDAAGRANEGAVLVPTDLGLRVAGYGASQHDIRRSVHPGVDQSLCEVGLLALLLNNLLLSCKDMAFTLIQEEKETLANLRLIVTMHPVFVVPC